MIARDRNRERDRSARRVRSPEPLLELIADLDSDARNDVVGPQIPGKERRPPRDVRRQLLEEALFRREQRTAELEDLRPAIS